VPRQLQRQHRGGPALSSVDCCCDHAARSSDVSQAGRIDLQRSHALLHRRDHLRQIVERNEKGRAGLVLEHDGCPKIAWRDCERFRTQLLGHDTCWRQALARLTTGGVAFMR
jgi:hypothetical protein